MERTAKTIMPYIRVLKTPATTMGRPPTRPRFQKTKSTRKLHYVCVLFCSAYNLVWCKIGVCPATCADCPSLYLRKERKPLSCHQHRPLPSPSLAPGVVLVLMLPVIAACIAQVLCCNPHFHERTQNFPDTNNLTTTKLQKKNSMFR